MGIADNLYHSRLSPLSDNGINRRILHGRVHGVPPSDLAKLTCRKVLYEHIVIIDIVFYKVHVCSAQSFRRLVRPPVALSVISPAIRYPIAELSTGTDIRASINESLQWIAPRSR